jgi:hypothetical protein
MGMDSYLEIFTTMYGWMFSSIITRVLLDTGLYLLPVVFMLVGIVLQAHEQGLDTDGIEWLVRRLEIQVGVTLFMFFMCVQTLPGLSLSKASLEFVPTPTAADPTPAPATGDSPDSTYGSAFAGGSDVAAVPPWWYLVMGLSSGANSAVRAGIGSSIRDFRMIEDLAHMAALPDTKLRGEAQRFYSECFVPARSRYLRQEAPSPQAQAAIATYGEQDVDWMGSHAFRDDPTLYADLYAKNPVPGFPYDPARDTEYDPAGDLPTYGKPSCKDWWEASGAGLQARLVDQVGSFQNLRTRIANVFSSLPADAVDDQLARLAIVKADPEYVDPERQIGFTRAQRPLSYAVQDVAGFFGTAWEAFKASASMIPLVQSLLMMQPMVLMTLYMFLSTIVILSGYRIEVFVLGAVAIFTVKFWAVMWTIARFVDDRLIEAMYPGANGNALLEVMFTADGTSKRMILNIVMMLMYVGIPAIWTLMMAWGGFNLAGAMSQMLSKAAAVGTAAGSVGAGGAGRLTSGATRRMRGR